MHDARAIPQDLESCQRQLHEAWALHAELSETCTTLQCGEEKLRQENEELQATIKHLLRQLYGRRRERFVEGAGQQHLDFGDDDLSDPSLLSAAPQDPVFEEILVRRRKGGRKPRSEKLPEHVERRTERIEPQPPEGIRLEDCELIGVDVVEIPEYQRGKLWVRRVEYPKYKLPSSAWSPEVVTQPVTEAKLAVAIEPVAIEPGSSPSRWTWKPPWPPNPAWPPHPPARPDVSRTSIPRCGPLTTASPATPRPAPRRPTRQVRTFRRWSRRRKSLRLRQRT